ncbi:MAG: hypothetical protein P8X68_10530, partial [Desulfobacterales bacterium]
HPSTGADIPLAATIQILQYQWLSMNMDPAFTGIPPLLLTPGECEIFFISDSAQTHKASI